MKKVSKNRFKRKVKRFNLSKQLLGLLKNFGQKKVVKKRTNSKNIRPSETLRKSKFFYSKPQISSKSNRVRVIKPAENKLLKERIKDTVVTKKSHKQFLFGFKNFERPALNLPKISSNIFFKNFNLWLAKFRIKERTTRFVALSLLLILFLFASFLSFFDTYFLIRDYKIIFPKTNHDSYLSEKELTEVLNSFDGNRLAWFFPYNQFWFVNDFSLTAAAKQAVPEVESVSVKKRTWPNAVDLEIKTEPILVTLGVWEKNQKKYWRISQNGKIVTQDTAQVLENLVFVETPISLSSDPVTGEATTLQDYKLENNLTQLNRFWFITWLWQKMEDHGLEYTGTHLPSLLDTDVILIMPGGTRLLFDSNVDNVSRQAMNKRIDAVFRTKLKQDLIEGELAYIDFRVKNKRVVACYKSEPCSQD